MRILIAVPTPVLARLIARENSVIFDDEQLFSVTADQPVNTVAKQQTCQRTEFGRRALIFAHMLKGIKANSPGVLRVNLLRRKAAENPFSRDPFDTFPNWTTLFDLNAADPSQISVNHLAIYDQWYRSENH